MPTMLLALTGNALMAPRALRVKVRPVAASPAAAHGPAVPCCDAAQDPAWLAGTTWAILAGWGQLLGMFLKRSPSTGCVHAVPAVPLCPLDMALLVHPARRLSYVDPAVFAATSALLGVYALFVLWQEKQEGGRAKAAA